MARTDTLGHFLTDVADAIRGKKGSQETIQASDFDTEIANLPSGGGADLNEYFYTEITENTNVNNMSEKIIKKAPDVIVADNVTSLSRAYYSCPSKVLPKVICNSNVLGTDYMYYYTQPDTLDVSGLNTTNVATMRSMFNRSNNQPVLTNIIWGVNFKTDKVTDYRSMFAGDNGLQSLDLSHFSCDNANNLSTGGMFQNCSALMHLDMRNFEFTKIANFSNMFNGVPDACEIIVKDSTQKTWFSTNFSRFTNVKTVTEYENE